MKFKVGDRAKMTEMNGGYDFSNDPIDGYAESFKPGDIVIIHGDKSDYTDHLDGVHGVVVAVDDRDCTVVVPNEHMAKKFMDWKIWKWNMTKC